VGNKFTSRRGHPKKPAICISKPPPKPYQYPPYPGSEYDKPLDVDQAWVAAATLPAIPEPPFEPITVRNLAFHCYPSPRTPTWFQNLHELSHSLDLFNGRRVVAIATGPGLVPPHIVQNVLGRDVEYFQIQNHPRLREVASFHGLLDQLRSTASNEATFWAHSKGTSEHHATNHDKQLAIRYWRNRMYRELLVGWPDVAVALQTAAAVGCFKIDYSCFPDHVMHSPTGLEWGTWHFAGNFWWIRHDQIFRNPKWSAIADDPYAGEMWLGNLIDTRLAATVYQPWNPIEHPAPNLYDPQSHDHPIF